jgi:hypothetical protein
MVSDSLQLHKVVYKPGRHKSQQFYKFNGEVSVNPPVSYDEAGPRRRGHFPLGCSWLNPSENSLVSLGLTMPVAELVQSQDTGDDDAADRGDGQPEHAVEVVVASRAE